MLEIKVSHTCTNVGLHINPASSKRAHQKAGTNTVMCKRCAPFCVCVHEFARLTCL
jgi:hypothetical protein